MFRRIMIFVVAIALMGFALPGCESTTTEATPTPAPATKAPTEAPAATEAPPLYKQSPYLDAAVEGGELPPVDERLPLTPFECTPTESVGTYGGTLVSACQPALGVHSRGLMLGDHFDNLLAWNQDNTERIPTLAADMEVSDDLTTYTYSLRMGLKWSDGEPFTTADVEYWFNDVVKNADLSPGGVPTSLKDIVDGSEVTLNIIDEYTFSFQFANPNPNLNDILYSGWFFPYAPKHYLSQFNSNYADVEDLNETADDAGFTTWVEYYNNRASSTANPELPTINAYILQNSWDGATRVTYKRNPYYWKVDTEGNQLPYIDELIIDVIEDASVLTLNTMNGDYDLMGFPIAQNTSDISLFKENEERGNYKVFLEGYTETNVLPLFFNLNTKNEVLNQVFNDKRFRFAMSYALDRQNIIDTFVNIGPIQMEPRNCSILPNSAYYSEEADKMAKTAVEFDQAQANSLLDEMGLDQRDADGFRIGPDGKTFEFVLQCPTWSDWLVDIAQRVCEQWQAVGVKAVMQAVDVPLWSENVNPDNNAFDATCVSSFGGFLTYNTNEMGFWAFLGYDSWCSMFKGAQWAKWGDTDGASGIEPPADIKQLQELGVQMSNLYERSDKSAVLDQMLAIWQENLYVLGICLKPPYYLIIGNDVKNVSPYISSPWIFGCFHAYDGVWQYYLTE